MSEQAVDLKNVLRIVRNAQGTKELETEIYQLYLNTLPANNINKQFIRRKNTRGFSNDALRNFITKGKSLSLRLDNIEFLPQIKNEIESARENIKDRPRS